MKSFGALFLNLTNIEALDHYEGKPNSYQRKIFTVIDDKDNKYSAWVYFRNPHNIGQPSEEYKNIVCQGAKECGLPDEYIKKIP
ncbi:MAG: gamma-glutamylcyclotransferase [Candidatus Hydrogenedens sp.]